MERFPAQPSSSRKACSCSRKAAHEEDVGAVLGEEACAGGARDDVGEVQDLEAREGAPRLVRGGEAAGLNVARLPEGEEGHRAHGPAHGRGLPLRAAPQDAGRGARGEGELLELLRLHPRDLRGKDAPVGLARLHGEGLRGLLEGEGLHELGLLALVVDVEGDVAAVRRSELVEGAVEGVVHAEAGLEAGLPEGLSLVVGEVEPDGLEAREGDVAGSRAVGAGGRAEPAHVPGCLVDRGEGGGGGRGLEDLLPPEELRDAAEPEEAEDRAVAGEGVVPEAGRDELGEAPQVGDEGHREVALQARGLREGGEATPALLGLLDQGAPGPEAGEGGKEAREGEDRDDVRNWRHYRSS